MTIAESAEMVTRAAQLVTFSAVLNIVSWVLLIYSAFKLRAASNALRSAAQAGVTRTGGDAQTGSGAEGTSTRSPEGDAPTPDRHPTQER